MDSINDTSQVIIALSIVEALNSRLSRKLADLMTENHEFIDTDDNSIRDKRALIEAWQAYFRLFLDFEVSIDQATSSEDLVILLGSSTGSMSEYARGLSVSFISAFMRAFIFICSCAICRRTRQIRRPGKTLRRPDGSAAQEGDFQGKAIRTARAKPPTKECWAACSCGL